MNSPSLRHLDVLGDFSPWEESNNHRDDVVESQWVTKSMSQAELDSSVDPTRGSWKSEP